MTKLKSSPVLELQNKDDDFEKTSSPQNENASPVLQENVQKICKKINNDSSYFQENQENTIIASVDSGKSYKLI